MCKTPRDPPEKWHRRDVRGDTSVLLPAEGLRASSRGPRVPPTEEPLLNSSTDGRHRRSNSSRATPLSPRSCLPTSPFPQQLTVMCAFHQGFAATRQKTPSCPRSVAQALALRWQSSGDVLGGCTQHLAPFTALVSGAHWQCLDASLELSVLGWRRVGAGPRASPRCWLGTQRGPSPPNQSATRTPSLIASLGNGKSRKAVRKG